MTVLFASPFCLSLSSIGHDFLSENLSNAAGIHLAAIALLLYGLVVALQQTDL